MKGDPMQISLKLNTIPKKVTGARRVPIRYKEGADSVVQDLINKKVIIPVNITTDWCSPAFFVPKANMKWVRFVTDYSTNLSRSRFTAEILQAIPSSETCFEKTRCSPWILPVGTGTQKFIHNYISTSTRKIQIYQGTNGVERFLLLAWNY